jgi:hypothetical protein
MSEEFMFINSLLRGYFKVLKGTKYTDSPWQNILDKYNIHNDTKGEYPVN